MLENLKTGGLLVLTAACVMLSVMNAGLKLDVAQLQTELADQRGAHAEATLRHEAELARREREHAHRQQGAEDIYADQKAKLDADIAAERRVNDRLRDDLRRATAKADRDATDPATCQRAIDSLDQLGGLAGEGVELLQEADGLLRERDLDVQRLQQQVAEDRRACSPKSTP